MMGRKILCEITHEYIFMTYYDVSVSYSTAALHGHISHVIVIVVITYFTDEDIEAVKG